MRLTTRMLPELDGQDVFDIAAWHLLRQHSQAIAPGTSKCMYRAPDGKRCAVGWLMPDDVYSRSLEFFSVRDLASMMLDSTRHEYHAFAAFLIRHMVLLSDLQHMHDSNPPVQWPARLRVIAHQNDLNARVIDHGLAECDPARLGSVDDIALGELAW
ncbi:MAG TPA: hypothetical protein VJU59_10515 [Paraburkholderia sp.]|uniref:hypothetical protein n=1 Tax=Paraburkholderia sp. TaxID=1926495 RepID=UPI002B49748C|nr:hypothetical protein [Paraburkholderia sp.]HKR40089.1 hypothetical protein [Paraburkholderia sp.]